MAKNCPLVWSWLLSTGVSKLIKFKWRKIFFNLFSLKKINKENFLDNSMKIFTQHMKNISVCVWQKKFKYFLCFYNRMVFAFLNSSLNDSCCQNMENSVSMMYKWKQRKENSMTQIRVDNWCLECWLSGCATKSIFKPKSI